MKPLVRMSTRRSSFGSEGRVLGGGDIESNVSARAPTAGAAAAVFDGGVMVREPSLRAYIAAPVTLFDSLRLGGNKTPPIENFSSSERGGSTFGGGDITSTARSTVPLMEKLSSSERAEMTLGGGETGLNALL
jgi:hypothetical protein